MSPAFAQTSAPVLHSGEATFEGLGDLPGGVFHSEAYGVSADGTVIVGSSSSTNTGEGFLEAFRWENGEIAGLGDLEGGVFASQALDVSADGSVVVGRGISVDGDEAFRWEAASDTMIGLGDFPEGSHLSIANAVSADGSVVVGLGFSENGEEAFRWEDGEMVGLGFLPGGTLDVSQARDVSADGAVVIGVNPFQAFRWEGGEMVGLGFLPGGVFGSLANAISTDGSVIVGSSDSENDIRAFRWEDGEMVGLGAISDELSNTEALAVSSDASVVVGFGGDEFGENTALIWKDEDGTRVLKEMLETDFGLDLTGWTLQEARDISNDGTVIVGVGVNPDGDAEGWRAFLPFSGSPPENDDIADAALILFDGSYEGTNVGATLEDDEAEVSCLVPGWTTNFSVWWYFIRDIPPDVTFGATISTEGSSFDTVLSLHTLSSDDPLQLDEIACNDNAVSPTVSGQESGNLWSLLENVPITGGETYLVRVAGYNEQTPELQQGDIQLEINTFAIEDEASPEQIAEGLSVPIPNPASELSMVSVAVGRGQEVTVEVFDVTGRRVQTLYDGTLLAGMGETLTFDASALPAGVYVIRATGEDFVKTRRVTIVR